MNIRNKLLEIIKRYWFIIHMLFIILYILYAIYLSFFVEGPNPLNASEYNGVKFNLIWFCISILGFSILVFSVLLKRLSFSVRIILLVIGYTVTSFGLVKSADPSLKWKGNDVAWGNYDAATEVKTQGPVFVINSWNDRTDPNLNESFSTIKDSVKSFVKKFELSSISLNKWKGSSFPSGVSQNNNRPYMHPPFTPVLIGYWLKLFPFNKWSAELLMILISLCSFIVVIYYYRQTFFTASTDKILVLILFTMPAIIRFPHPTAEPLIGLLLIFSVILLLKSKENIAFNYFSGLLIGIAFFSKFNIIFYILFQTIMLLLKYKTISLKPFILYSLGIITIFIIFTALGYYFWLTFLTGTVYAKLYALMHPVSFLAGISDLVYFGPTLFLVLALLIINRSQIPNDSIIVVIPLIISIIISSIYLWNLSTLSRYLTFYIPVLTLFLIPSLRGLHLKTKDIIIVPIANLVFILITIFT